MWIRWITVSVHCAAPCVSLWGDCQPGKLKLCEPQKNSWLLGEIIWSASLVQRMVFLNACPCVIWLQGFSCTWRFWRACRTICRHPSNLVALGLLRCVSRDLEKKHQWGGADDFASWSRRVWSGGTWQNLGAFPCCNCWNRNGNMFFFEPRAGRYTLRVHRLFNFCSHLPSLCCFDLVSVA